MPTLEMLLNMHKPCAAPQHKLDITLNISYCGIFYNAMIEIMGYCRHIKY